MIGEAGKIEVLVIVPTHDHASTLDLAVLSALGQTITDLDVVIIGDGVGEDTRAVVHELRRRDDRVRFIDRPKSPSRAEDARHEVISASRARVVTYLGDDDLFLPDHVASMVELLADHDFAHPFPIFIDANNRLLAYPSDLSDPRCVAWHLHPTFNTVSLTGAAHTAELYRRLPHGWQQPPPNRWSDHFFWGQLFTLPGVRLATSGRATTIKPSAVFRREMGPDGRRASLQAWRDRMQEPGFRAWWDHEVTEAVRRSAVDTFMSTALQREEIAALREEIPALREEIPALREEIAALREEIAALRAENAALRAENAALRVQLRRDTLVGRLRDARNSLRRLLARRRPG